jgi:hypothetical protein
MLKVSGCFPKRVETGLEGSHGVGWRGHGVLTVEGRRKGH